MTGRFNYHIPKQLKGGSHDTKSIRHIDSSQALKEKYQKLKERFYSINDWQLFSGHNLAEFKLCNQYGEILHRIPKVNDYIRIKIPGPKLKVGNGYDWVQINTIIESEYVEFDTVLIECSPCKNPQSFSSSKTAHFYSSESSSSFVISRRDHCIQVSIHGRNEVPNLKVSGLDFFRNLFIAAGGILGFSKIEWKDLVDGLLDFG